MKKFVYNIAIATSILLGVSSCKGFLDRMPTDSVVAEIAMSTIDDAKIAVNGLYTDLKYYTIYGTYMICLGDMRADNLYPREINGSWSTFYNHDYTATQSTYFGLWQDYYNVIMKANTIIANIETIPVTSPSDEATKKDILGQAYAVRSLCYFDLARLYGYPYMKDNGASLGAVILPHDNGKAGLITADEAKELKRGTVAETYTQAFKDIESALGLLSKDENKGHFNYWAAKLHQGKMALYKGDNQLAYDACVEVIEKSPYSLVPNNKYLDYWGTEGNEESVLELLIRTEGNIDGDMGFNTIFHSLWFDDKGAGRSVIPTKKYIDLFASTPNDVRAKMLVPNDPEVSQIKNDEFTWLKKWIGNKDMGYTFRMNNPRVMRITDAYLMASEAALKLGGKQADADKYLNAVRKRADATATDVTATLSLVDLERQKEFIGEGHRFFDVMRNGGEIVRDVALDPRDNAGNPREVITWNTHTVVLPISETEQSVHTNLEQNPGY